MIPDYTRPDTSVTDTQELPIVSHYERWAHGVSSQFYPVPLRQNAFWPAGSAAPLGTSQPLGLLEEYHYGRWAIWLLPLVLLPLVIRYGGPRSLKLPIAVHRR